MEAVAPNMLAAMMNVRPSQLLDKDLWRVLGLEVAREGDSTASAALAHDDQTPDPKLRLPVL